MDIKRKLATVRTIKSVEPIEGADSIVKLTFESMGWVCVTNKDTNPQPGDKRVYFEVDSVLPKLPIFDFMEPYNYRVKTIKLRGQVSQGLTIPLDECLAAFNITTPVGTEEGADLTDLLGVVKYEIPADAQVSGDTKGPFPGFIEKTDELRAEEFDNLEQLLAEHEYDVTVKMDGSSGTFFIYNGEFGVCSRNQELKDTENNAFWKMARKYDIEARLRAMGGNFALQGEVAGPGIQKNRAGLKELELFVFTIQNIDTAIRFSNTAIENALTFMNEQVPTAEKLRMVPVLDTVPPLKTLADVKALSEGNSIVTDKTREGIVLRAKDNPNISFKYINPKYLLKHDL